MVFPLNMKTFCRSRSGLLAVDPVSRELTLKANFLMRGARHRANGEFGGRAGPSYFDLAPLKTMHSSDRYNVLLRHLKENPNNLNNAYVVYEMGKACIKTGRLDEAEKYFNIILSTHSAGRLRLFGFRGLALTSYYRKDYAKALFYYQRAIEADPNDTETHFDLGILWLNTGNMPKASYHFASIRSIEYESPDGLFGEGKVALAEADIKTASNRFKMILRNSPQGFLGHYGLALAALAEGRFDEAERRFNGLLQKNPLNPFCFAGLGQAALARKQYGHAIELFMRALEFRPHELSFKNYLDLARSAQKKDRQYGVIPGGSANALPVPAERKREGLEMPDHINLRSLKTKSPHRQYDRLKKYFNANPSNLRDSYALHFMGVACTRLNHFDEAEEYFKRLQLLDPNDPLALKGLGKVAEYRKLFPEFIDLDPIKRLPPAEQVKKLKEYCDKSPANNRHCNTLWLLASAYTNLGNSGEAIRHIRAAEQIELSYRG